MTRLNPQGVAVNLSETNVLVISYYGYIVTAKLDPEDTEVIRAIDNAQLAAAERERQAARDRQLNREACSRWKANRASAGEA